ncbi:DUF4365 domain-containing protein [Streptomyces sp. WI04-05B]|uniref:DUF4365 domain-containing protein n=1 Tax=Streptomyces turgidiscabies (strain Car8) TaxID=698760 RepID=L7F4B8_STRT8|nr:MULTISPECIES: DUF4365 domain-containing protein [Streptomyces]ELP65856.1 hypothetical protein STRTUCAR8_01805 [Streptomyces turgidiscabies Car8]MDX2548550.1 DUF4365 domain-containing protein [Streptomyces sp. WI04-05B]MDX2582590.1 DUF4365 domain-containing protein [Streptomyces sp. WI04-05A]MDX3499729.1 DUF4365 domain-containing protein [Streptomyces turgidiscabies]GAQ77317.1 hypothetical protein T45_09135 [Streptomyces turgidiscabies]
MAGDADDPSTPEGLARLDARKSDARDLVDGQLPMSAREEQISLAFTRMITYAAGCAVKTHDTDYEGVDLTITSSVEYKRILGPQFDLQLKATIQHGRLTDEHLAWPMKVKPYRKLVRGNDGKRHIPAYLGVLLLPEDATRWVDVDENRLITESRMFWQAASEFPGETTSESTHTVHLPRSNLFTVEQLLRIMENIGNNEGGAR